MAEIILMDEYLADRVSCPASIADNLQLHIRHFNKWLETDGRFKVPAQGGGLGYEFGRDDVFDWFNDVELADSVEKMTYLKRDYCPTDFELKTLPVFYV